MCNEPKDVGIVKIGSDGAIYRWYPWCRNGGISETLPRGAGWVPEAYMSFLLNHNYTNIYPHHIIHLNSVKLDNRPFNLLALSELKQRNIQFSNKPKPPLEGEFIKIGFYQEQIALVPKITRCGSCGLPMYPDNPTSGYLYSEPVCWWCISSDDTNMRTDLDGNDLLENTYIDSMRGLSNQQIIYKYQRLGFRDIEDALAEIEYINI